MPETFVRFGNTVKHTVKDSLGRLKVCVMWIVLASLVGLIAGGYGGAFAFSLKQANRLFSKIPWLLYALPFAGLLIVFLYRLLGVEEDRGTNLVISSINSHEDVPGRMAILIFISTIFTHMCGGSAGREGAALQMGGSIGSFFAHKLKRNEKDTKIMVMCGMSAAFSAVFGTPIAAVVFPMEVISIGIMHYSALMPCVFASIVASILASKMGLEGESYALTEIPALGLVNFIKIFILAAACAVVSMVFIGSLHKTGKMLRKLFANPYIRVFAGGLAVIGMTFLAGSRDYNGAGSQLIEKAVIGGEVAAAAFLLKIIFTSVTLQSGFKGGEIVPSFAIGATFGCLAGKLLGLPPTFCAALGMVSVFCGVTNCPLTTLIIGLEMFGFKGVPFFMAAVSVSYLMSGYGGLYSDQIIVYSKYHPRFINRHAGYEDDDYGDFE